MTNQNPTDYATPFTFDHPMVQLVIERVTAINRKVTPQDCEQSKTLRQIAEWYAMHYDGTFDFMRSMHTNFQRFGKLSPAQCSSTVNCLMADWVYLQKQLRQAEQSSKGFRGNNANGGTSVTTHNTFVMPEATLPNPPTPIAPIQAQPQVVTPVCYDGTFTVVLDETGDYRTLRLATIADHKLGNKPQGTQIASYLFGSNNDSDFRPFAFVFGDRVGMFKDPKSTNNASSASKLSKALNVLLTSDRERQVDLGAAYAIESGNCWRCGRTLTVPASVARGLGPICAEKLGI